MGAEEEAAARQALQAPAGGAAPKKDAGGKGALCEWRAFAAGEGESGADSGGGGGLELVQQFPVTHVAWHARGDYFASVAPTGNTQVRVPTKREGRKGDGVSEESSCVLQLPRRSRWSVTFSSDWRI